MNKNKYSQALQGLGVLAMAGMLVGPVAAYAQSPEQIIRDRCLGCHSETGDARAPFSRISQQRKTPEGWQMTLGRMQQLRGLKISAEEKRQLVKYLADTQGLAPAETQGRRYVLERDRNVVENFADETFAGMCAGCHSGARVALQRRTPAEWEKVVHFHLGQFPTIELIAGARDKPWFQIASEELAPSLAKQFAFQDARWSAWQEAPKPALAGSWVIQGWLPEKGDFDARMRVAPDGDDRYNLAIEGRYADGSPLSGQGSALVYTGFEWRANLTIDGVTLRQVLAASEDGENLRGRMFLASANELGGRIYAVKEGPAVSELLGIYPSYLKQGAIQTLTLTGTGLEGKIALGDGVKVLREIERGAERVTLQVGVAPNAAVGPRSVRVGHATGVALAVYDRLARVEVTPRESIARIGGNGGQLPKQKAAYRAVGYAAGVDGQPGTEDDLRLGYMPASWSLKAFDEVAEHDKDLDFAGWIDARTGVFTPGDTGPNPARKMSTNNVGNLAVVARVADDGVEVSGENHLLVTVPTFIMPVIQ